MTTAGDGTAGGISRRSALAAAGTLLVGGCITVENDMAGGERGGNASSDTLPDDAGGRTRLGFTGDVMLGRNVDDYWSGRETGSVWDGLADRMRSLDGVCINLECCVSDRGERQPDRGYYFRAGPDWAVPALGDGNVVWASLANNHAMDFGAVALRDTLKHLDDGGIATAGAGPDAAAARASTTITIGDTDVAFVSFTDQAPAYAAGPSRPGTAYLDLDPDDARTRTVVRSSLLAARRADPDLLVASLHWGPNWVVEPAARYRAFGHWLVEAGVDVVHGHSAHVIQGVEVHDGGLILHDCGDYVDDYVIKPDLHNDRSFLFEVAVEGGDPVALRLVPVRIGDRTVRPADEEATAWLHDRMRRLSRPFGTTFERDDDELVLQIRRRTR